MEVINKDAATVSPPPAGGPAAPTSRDNAKVSISFIFRYTDVELLAVSARIIVGLTGNASYASPAPTLATLVAANSAFGSAVNELDRGTKSIAMRNQARAALADVLRMLALYVQQTCQGNLVTLISSGFPAQRRRGPDVLVVPPPPEGIKLMRGPASGQLKARCRPIPGATLYQWRYATAQAPTVWTLSDTSSSGAVMLDGLALATEYLVQARAYGKRGCGDWTDSVSVIVT